MRLVYGGYALQLLTKRVSRLSIAVIVNLGASEEIRTDITSSHSAVCFGTGHMLARKRGILYFLVCIERLLLKSMLFLID